MLGWVVRGIRDDAVCEGRFSIYGGCPFSRCLMNSDFQEIYLFIGFRFCCELHVRVERVKVLLYVFDACVVGVVNYQNVIHISKICSDVVFIEKLCDVRIFKFLKKEFCYES